MVAIADAIGSKINRDNAPAGQDSTLITRLEAAGAAYYPFPAPMGRERARLVASWSTTEADVDQFLAALR